MRYGQRGQVMAFIAVTLAIVLVPVAAYAIDAETLSKAAAALDAATATAAIDASQEIDVGALRAGGVLTIDPAAASRVARDALAAEVPAASLDSVMVGGAQVTVEAGELVELPFDFFARPVVRITARASAVLSSGYDRPSSLLSLARLPGVATRTILFCGTASTQTGIA